MDLNLQYVILMGLLSLLKLHIISKLKCIEIEQKLSEIWCSVFFRLTWEILNYSITKKASLKYFLRVNRQ